MEPAPFTFYNYVTQKWDLIQKSVSEISDDDLFDYISENEVERYWQLRRGGDTPSAAYFTLLSER